MIPKDEAGTYAAVCRASATMETRPAKVHFNFLTLKMSDFDAIFTAELIVNRERGSDRERGSGRDSIRDSGPSRADEADSWASAKKPSIGNGFERRDSRDGRDRGGFFDSQSKADESDSWVANKSFAPPPPAAESRRFGGGRGEGQG